MSPRIQPGHVMGRAAISCPLTDCLHVLRMCLFSDCSRTFEQEYGYLKSPGWPEVYPHNLDCTIILKAPENSIISLFFNSFDLEGHSSCLYDYLEVSSVDTS